MINHFKHLLNMALADLNIDTQELTLIYQLGLEKGVSKEVIDQLLLHPNMEDLDAPESLDEKVSLLYDLCLVIWADGEVLREEKELLNKVALQCHFLEENVEEICNYLLERVKEGAELSIILEEIANNSED